jgi:hypothetical protein
MRGEVISNTQCQNLPVTVDKQLYRLRADHQVVGSLIQRHQATLLDRHTGRHRQRSHPFPKYFEQANSLLLPPRGMEKGAPTSRWGRLLAAMAR